MSARRLLVAVVGASAVVAGCSGGSTTPTTAVPTTTATSTTTTTPAQPATALLAPGADVVIQGSGNQVVDVTNPAGPGGTCAIVVERPGGGSVQVTGLNDAGTRTLTFVTLRDGVPSAMRLMDPFLPGDMDVREPGTSEPNAPTTKLQVEAVGPWKVTLKPLANLPTWDGRSPLEGSGSAVFVLDPQIEQRANYAITTSADGLGFTAYTPKGPRNLDTAVADQTRGVGVLPAGSIVFGVYDSSSSGPVRSWRVETYDP